MTTHHLKTWPEPFADLVARRKTFELRRDDRNYQVGDVLHLQEWNPNNRRYTRAWVAAEVTHVLRGPSGVAFGLQPGYCVLSLHVTERTALASASGGAA